LSIRAGIAPARETTFRFVSAYLLELFHYRFQRMALNFHRASDSSERGLVFSALRRNPRDSLAGFRSSHIIA
jgi:hypothetical protein